MSYMNLDSDEIRTEAMLPPTERGVDNDTLEVFLSEWETDVSRRLGGTLPTDDPVMRGILRDLVASSAMRKIARSDEDRAAAREFHDSAIERLGAYEDGALPTYRITRGIQPWWDYPAFTDR